MRDDWDNLGPARALYESMATRAAEAATGFEPGRDVHTFARLTGEDSAEIHVVGADEETIDTMTKAMQRPKISIHAHLVERPDAEAAKRAEAAWQSGRLLPPPSDEAVHAPCDQCAHPPHDGHCMVALGPRERCGCGRPTLDVQTSRATDVTGPIEVRARVAVEPTDRAPFVLRVRRGRAVVHEAGPFERVTQAIDARDDWDGVEQGMVATIYDGSHVADYRGDRATFKYGRTQWSRDA